MQAAKRKFRTHRQDRKLTDAQRIELAAGWRRFLELMERIRREDAGEPLVRLERS